MMNFIVLGLVPGTGIQLNLNDILRVTAVLLLVLILAIKLRSFKHSPKITLKLFNKQT